MVSGNYVFPILSRARDVEILFSELFLTYLAEDLRFVNSENTKFCFVEI